MELWIKPTLFQWADSSDTLHLAASTQRAGPTPTHSSDLWSGCVRGSGDLKVFFFSAEPVR